MKSCSLLRGMESPRKVYRNSLTPGTIKHAAHIVERAQRSPVGRTEIKTVKVHASLSGCPPALLFGCRRLVFACLDMARRIGSRVDCFDDCLISLVQDLWSERL